MTESASSTWQTPTAQAVPTEKPTRQQVLSQATAVANAVLKDKYTDEWNAAMQKAAAVRGENWSPRLTEEQRAKKEYDDLIAKYPHLAQG